MSDFFRYSPALSLAVALVGLAVSNIGCNSKANNLAERQQALEEKLTAAIERLDALEARIAFKEGGRQRDAQDPVEARVVAAAVASIAQNRPEWLAQADHPPVVREETDYYVVTWQLPPGTVGGSPVAHVEKESLRVVDLYHTQ